MSLRAGALITLIVDVLPHHWPKKAEGFGRPDGW
jgi:hypothetical protein